ncbi:MAG: cysteine-rich CWC family protein [Betaproteobacteria bacterium]|nr:cysteine-rich CWC family protein [Betaproteobacteria bacterium]
MSAVPATVCPQCGAQFRCGMANGDKECWCASLPALSQIPAKTDGDLAAATCLCPACLQLWLAAEAAARAA